MGALLLLCCHILCLLEEVVLPVSCQGCSQIPNESIQNGGQR